MQNARKKKHEKEKEDMKSSLLLIKVVTNLFNVQ